MPEASHEILFRNGGVFDGRGHHAGFAVLVGRGRIVAIGPEGEVAGRASAQAVHVDLAGGLLLPGFQDAHVHPVQGGLERIRCDLTEAARPPEYVAAIADYAAANPDREWVTGGGWSIAAFGPAGPTVEALDAVVADRPVFLVNRDHHGAWVNSRALDLAGIDRHTPDPHDGRVERDATGRPTGCLHEGAMALVGRLLPSTTDADYLRAFLGAQEHLHSLGITAWQDAILGDYAGMSDPSATYLRVLEAGKLTARVRGALWWDRDRGAEQIEGLVERRSRLDRGRLQAGTVKIMQDGIAENFTAAMSADYLDGCGCRTGNRGLSFVDPQALRENVTRLDAAGFSVHVHAIGDRAVREALDAFEAARAANAWSDARHHIAHLQVIGPDDRPRFAALDVTANMQPLWAQADDQMRDMTLPYLPAGTGDWQYPFADLARSGARLAGGSDWPVSSADPLQGIHVAVNRSEYGGSGAGHGRAEAFLPEQRLSLQQAFAAYTAGSAYVNHLGETGRLAPGMLADVAVLDRDPFLGPPEQIGGARVAATYVDGEPVFVA